MNPTAKVPKAESLPVNASTFGKNSLLNTSAAAVPYRKKSYHSMVVPMKLAATTDLMELVSLASRPVSGLVAMVRPPLLLIVPCYPSSPDLGPAGGERRRWVAMARSFLWRVGG